MSDADTKTRQAIAEEAAAWFVEFQGQPPGRSTKRRFVGWLTESPVHIEEYLAVAKVFGALQHVDPKGDIDAEVIAQETVVRLHEDVDEPGRVRQKFRNGTGVPTTREALDQQDGIGNLDQPKRGRGSVRERTGAGLAQVARQRFWASAATLTLAIAAVALYIQGMGPDTYATRLGEQRSVLLDDGSVISLNTSTRIEVAYTEDARQVRLIQGEALFDVEKDVTRPFLVKTQAAVIRVTGTQFNVYDKDDSTAVTVLEGQVEVAPRDVEPRAPATAQSTGSSGDSAGAVARLTAGNQALVRRGSAEIETVAVASPEAVTAWTERRLVFDATPLSEIVQQFNRYNRKKLVLEDPTLASLELSGVFDSNDPESLVLFLKRISDVEAVTSANGREIRIRAPKTAP